MPNPRAAACNRAEGKGSGDPGRTSESRPAPSARHQAAGVPASPHIPPNPRPSAAQSLAVSREGRSFLSPSPEPVNTGRGQADEGDLPPPGVNHGGPPKAH